jgi:hypothetical protein
VAGALFDPSLEHVPMLDILDLLTATTTHALTLIRHRRTHIAMDVTVLICVVTFSNFGLVVLLLVMLLFKSLLDELILKDASYLLLIVICS